MIYDDFTILMIMTPLLMIQKFMDRPSTEKKSGAPPHVGRATLLLRGLHDLEIHRHGPVTGKNDG